jgi:hypothetical protein
MEAFDPATLDRWRALAIVDRDGTTVGTISEFYLDRETGHPTWALVNTGLFGATQTFVPLVHATEISDGLQVPYEKSHIKDTPKVDLHDDLSPEEEAELFAHYGVDYQPSGEPPDAAGPGPAEGPGPVRADPGVAEAVGTGSAEGSGRVGVDAGVGGSPTVVDAGSAPTEAPGGVDTALGERPQAADSEGATGEVPAEPAPVDAAETVDAGSGPAPAGTIGPAPIGPGQHEGDAGHTSPGSQEANDTAAAEPGTAQYDAANDRVSAEPGTTEPHAANDRVPAEPGTTESEGANATIAAESGATEPGGATPPGLDAERSRTAGHDPDLARTAPVEPGLPGSTSASPYGPGPASVDKGVAGSSGPTADESVRALGQADFAPGTAAGTFEEHEPFDRPTGASDRWREAKLAAERDRVARTAAAQPEERSPLERARRRLERLVGGGQDDPDDISPADRDAAERARRARLGLDEDDHRRP